MISIAKFSKTTTKLKTEETKKKRSEKIKLCKTNKHQYFCDDVIQKHFAYCIIVYFMVYGTREMKLALVEHFLQRERDREK